MSARLAAAARRVRTPTIFQMEAVECGAAALAMILAYYGRMVPLEELRIACGISRDGSRANNIVKAARSYGLTAAGYKLEPADLKTQRMPVIVYWNFNHFLVVEGFARGRFYLNDPALGPRWVSAEEFDQSFTGVVLVCEPGPDFKKGGHAPSLVRALQARLGGSTRALAYVLAASVLLVVLGLVTPAFTRIFIDTFLVGGRADWIAPLLAAMALTALVVMALTSLQQQYLLRLETKLALSMSSRFFWHVLHLPLEFFTQRYAGDIAARVGINDSVAQLLSGALATNFLNVALIALYALLMFQIDSGLTLLGISIAALNVAALRLVARARADRYQRLLQERGKLTGTATYGLQSIETLKASGAESDYFAQWAGLQAKVLNAEQELSRITTYLSIVLLLLTALNATAILVAGGLRIMDADLSIGGLIAFQALMFGFIGPVNALVGLGGVLQETQGDIKRLDDVLHYPTVDDSPHQRMPNPQSPINNQQSTIGNHEFPIPRLPSSVSRLSGYLDLCNLTFGYSRLEPALIESFSLSLKPGMRVALVGGSGSGKSTIAKLIGGLYKPWSGEIRFDGQPRHEHSPARIHASLAMVDQDIFLFEGTIKQNLTLWDTSIPASVVIQAAKDAAIHEDIARRPGGYDFPVEEGGRNFSGGQRQRLEIARALSGNPSLLVLDEATSALDPITEKIIDDNLRRRGCTCLIVAHRLSTIRDCDEIIVLERGKVFERGTHDELVRARGAYAKLMHAESTAKSVLDLLDE